MKRNKIQFLGLFLLALLLIIASGCGGQESSGGEQNSSSSSNDQGTSSSGSSSSDNNNEQELESYTWKIGFNTVEGSVRDVAAQRFKEVVEEKTNGRITIETYPNEALGSEQEMVEAVQVGALDMQLVGANMVANLIPEYDLLGLPYLVSGFDEAYAVLDGPIGEKWRKLGEQHGLKVLTQTDLGFTHLTNNERPINDVSDLEGITMRAPNSPVLIETYKALGSSVSTMPFTEVYLALSQGVVDGQFNPLDAIYETKFHEVQDYLAITNDFYYYVAFTMNLDLWESLDPELQEIVQEAAYEARDATREFSQRKDEEMLEVLDEHFVEITFPDTALFREKVMPVYDLIAERVGQEQIDELIQFLEEYRSQK